MRTQVVGNPWSWGARVDDVDPVSARAAVRSLAVEAAEACAFLSPRVEALRVLDAVGAAADHLAKAAAVSGPVNVVAGGAPDGVDVRVGRAARDGGADVFSVSLLGCAGRSVTQAVRHALRADASGEQVEGSVAAVRFAMDAVSVRAAAWDLSVSVWDGGASVSVRAHRPAELAAA